ncbi:hypothetical protein [Nitrosomonas sp.]|uniref:hypothetical protein n=1 Tax=Nitrosomonas sp. TaxID=42353 RepID=UPI0025D0A386|nr:hypothetical protein [Nitrosomonas sp.]
MLKGKELGYAIAEAIKLKIASGAVSSKKEIADYFGIQPPSIHDWIKKGSISKDKLPKLWDYFSDVVGPEHWGLKEKPPVPSIEETSEDKDLLDLLGIEKNNLDFDQIEIIRAVMKIKKDHRPDLKKIVRRFADSTGKPKKNDVNGDK